MNGSSGRALWQLGLAGGGREQLDRRHTTLGAPGIAFTLMEFLTTGNPQNLSLWMLPNVCLFPPFVQ